MSKANERLRDKLKKRIDGVLQKIRWGTGERNIKRIQLLHERGHKARWGHEFVLLFQKILLIITLFVLLPINCLSDYACRVPWCNG